MNRFQKIITTLVFAVFFVLSAQTTFAYEDVVALEDLNFPSSVKVHFDSPNNRADISVATDGDGTPHVAFTVYDQYDEPNMIQIWSYSATNGWKKLHTISRTGKTLIKNPILRFDGTTPYVAFVEERIDSSSSIATFYAQVFTYNGKSWVQVGDSPSADWIPSLDFEIDAKGKYIAYRGEVRNLSGGKWLKLGGDVYKFDDTKQFLPIQLSSNNGKLYTAHAIYGRNSATETYNQIISHLDGNSWKVLATPVTPYHCDMAIPGMDLDAKSGSPYVFTNYIPLYEQEGGIFNNDEVTGCGYTYHLGRYASPGYLKGGFTPVPFSKRSPSGRIYINDWIYEVRHPQIGYNGKRVTTMHRNQDGELQMGAIDGTSVKEDIYHIFDNDNVPEWNEPGLLFDHVSEISYSLGLDRILRVHLLDKDYKIEEFNISTDTVTENIPNNSTVATFNAKHILPKEVKFELISGTGDDDNDYFYIDGNKIKIKKSPDFERKSSYTYRVRVSSDGRYVDKIFTITVNDVFEPASDFNLPSATVYENQKIGTLVGKFGANDIQGGPYTYTLVSGAGDIHNAFFSISGDKVLTNAIFDYESQKTYSIRAQITDPWGLLNEKQFIITIDDENEPMTGLKLPKISINEGNLYRTKLSAFSVDDVDANNTYAYKLISGLGSDDNNKFTIVKDTLYTRYVFDYEAQKSGSIRVEVFDGKHRLQKTFGFGVVDKNDPPTGITISNNTIQEGNIKGAIVGTLSAVDQDGTAGTYIYSIDETWSGHKNGIFSITGDSLVMDIVSDYETDKEYHVMLKVLDNASGESALELITITVLNANEAPVIPGGDSRTISFDEYQTNEEIRMVATLSATDPDNDIVTFSISGDDAGLFYLQPNSWKLRYNGAYPDFEKPTDKNKDNKYELTVTATDRGTPSKSATQKITVVVNDVAENLAPTDISISTTDVNENVVKGTTIATLSATDANTADTHTFSLAAGNYQGRSYDNSSFVKIDGNKVILDRILDYETDTSHSINVQVDDGRGGKYTKHFFFSVKDVNEAPVIKGGWKRSVTVKEGGINITTLQAVDPDVGQSVTYSVSGDDAAHFSMNSTTGVMTMTKQLSSEPKDKNKDNIYRVDLVATDNAKIPASASVAYDVTVLGTDGPTDIDFQVDSLDENQSAGSQLGVFKATNKTQGSHTFTLVSGTGDDDNGDFSVTTNGALKITAAPNYETKNTYSIRVQTKDKNNKTLEESFTLGIKDKNDRPIITGGATRSFNVQTGIKTIGKIVATDEDEKQGMSYSIINTGMGDANFVTIDNSGNLSFKSAPNYDRPQDFSGGNNSYTFSVRATDSSGDVHTNRSKDQAITVNVTKVPNKKPTGLSLSNNSVDENTLVNTVLGTLSTTDADTTDSHTYTLVAGTGSTDNSSYKISGSNLLIASSPDYEKQKSHSVRIRTTDNSGEYFEKFFTISINDKQEAPVFKGGSSREISILENKKNVFSLEAEDDDNKKSSLLDRQRTLFALARIANADDSDGLSYSITGGADQSAFSINSSTGEISFKISPDFENPHDANKDNTYQISVSVQDKNSMSDTQDVYVKVTDVTGTSDVSNSIQISNLDFDEETNFGNIFIGDISILGPDASDLSKFTLVSGPGSTDNWQFYLSGFKKDKLNFSYIADYETKSVYKIRVRAANKAGDSIEKTFAVTVNDVNEAPIFDSGSIEKVGVPENSIEVGTITATDIDSGQKLSYSLEDYDASLFSISGEGEITFDTAPDYERPHSKNGSNNYYMKVRVTDNGTPALSDVHDIKVEVTNEMTDDNSKPFNIQLSKSDFKENIPKNTVVANMRTSDDDLDDQHVYSLVSGIGGTDNNSFVISGDKLVLLSSPDYEQKRSYSVRLKTTDNHGDFFEKAFTFNVININEHIPIITGGISRTLNLNENSQKVGFIAASDADSAAITYTLDGEDASEFLLDKNTGELSFKWNPDYEKPSDIGKDNSYTLIATATDDGVPKLSSRQTLTVNVLDIDENKKQREEEERLAEEERLRLEKERLAEEERIRLEKERFKDKTKDDTHDDNTDGDTGDDGIDDILDKDKDVFEINLAPEFNAGPEITISRNENETRVGKTAVTDPNDGQLVTFAVVGGIDASLFEIGGDTGNLSFMSAPDFESPRDNNTDNVYEVVVRATDNGTPEASATQNLTIKITDVDENEPPSDIILSHDVIPEGLNAGGTVGILSAADAQTDTHRFELAGGLADNDLFSIDQNILIINVIPDFQIKPEYHIVIRATDQAGLMVEKPFILRVDKRGIAPFIHGGDHIDIETAENSLISSYDIHADDPDTLFPLEFRLEGPDAERFSFLSTDIENNRRLVFRDNPDFEFPRDVNQDNIYHIIIVVSDDSSPALSDRQEVFVHIIDIPQHIEDGLMDDHDEEIELGDGLPDVVIDTDDPDDTEDDDGEVIFGDDSPGDVEIELGDDLPDVVIDTDDPDDTEDDDGEVIFGDDSPGDVEIDDGDSDIPTEFVIPGDFTPGHCQLISQDIHPGQADGYQGIFEIARLQNTLNILDYHAGPINGVYNDLTLAAVARLQNDYGINNGGITDPVTRDVINALCEQKNYEVPVFVDPFIDTIYDIPGYDPHGDFSPLDPIPGIEEPDYGGYIPPIEPIPHDDPYLYDPTFYEYEEEVYDPVFYEEEIYDPGYYDYEYEEDFYDPTLYEYEEYLYDPNESEGVYEQPVIINPETGEMIIIKSPEIAVEKPAEPVEGIKIDLWEYINFMKSRL